MTPASHTTPIWSPVWSKLLYWFWILRYTQSWVASEEKEEGFLWDMSSFSFFFFCKRLPISASWCFVNCSKCLLYVIMSQVPYFIPEIWLYHFWLFFFQICLPAHSVPNVTKRQRPCYKGYCYCWIVFIISQKNISGIPKREYLSVLYEWLKLKLLW